MVPGQDPSARDRVIGQFGDAKAVATSHAQEDPEPHPQVVLILGLVSHPVTPIGVNAGVVGLVGISKGVAGNGNRRGDLVDGSRPRPHHHDDLVGDPQRVVVLVPANVVEGRVVVVDKFPISGLA